MLDIVVLGPFAVRMHGCPVTPSAGKPRQVLALLALRADQVVPVSVLMEEIWGERPPRSAATTLQTYVLQLRRLLGAAVATGSAKDVLVTRHGGYQLVLAGGRIDAREFERLTAEGDAACEAGDDLRAAARYREGLALWRGSALVDVPCGPLLQLDTLRLEEMHRGVLERRITADLSLGRHTTVIPELRALVAQHPRHEGFSVLLMRALHRSGGGVAEALAEYRRLRSALIEEIGVEPSPAVRALHQSVLDGTLEGYPGLGPGPPARPTDSRAGYRDSGREPRLTS